MGNMKEKIDFDEKLVQSSEHQASQTVAVACDADEAKGSTPRLLEGIAPPPSVHVPDNPRVLFIGHA